MPTDKCGKKLPWEEAQRSAMCHARRLRRAKRRARRAGKEFDLGAWMAKAL